MVRYEQPRNPAERDLQDGITRLTVAGFKSIAEERSIEIRPLTILAGANSSGKSSMMQPLLLLEQTLEAPYDPGVLKLDGPNVRFTSAGQIFSVGANRLLADEFTIGVTAYGTTGYTVSLTYEKNKGIELRELIGYGLGMSFSLRPHMSKEQIRDMIDRLSKSHYLYFPLRAATQSASIDRQRSVSPLALMISR